MENQKQNKGVADAAEKDVFDLAFDVKSEGIALAEKIIVDAVLEARFAASSKAIEKMMSGLEKIGIARYSKTRLDITMRVENAIDAKLRQLGGFDAVGERIDAMEESNRGVARVNFLLLHTIANQFRVFAAHNFESGDKTKNLLEGIANEISRILKEEEDRE